MGRPPTISRAAAAAAALAIIDEEGLAAASLEAVARRLGVRAPSLYNHFTDRQDLLSEVARTVMAECPDGWPPVKPDDWRASLEERAVVVRRNMLNHPNAAPLLLQLSHNEVYAEKARTWDAYFAEQGLSPAEISFVREGSAIITFGGAVLAAAEITNARAGIAGAVERDHSPGGREEELFRATVRSFYRGALEDPAPAKQAPSKQVGEKAAARLVTSKRRRS